MKRLIIYAMVFSCTFLNADENTWKHLLGGGLMSYGVGGACFVVTGKIAKWRCGVIGLAATNVASFAMEAMDAGDRKQPIDKADLAVTGIGSLVGAIMLWGFSENKDVMVTPTTQAGAPGLSIGMRF